MNLSGTNLRHLILLFVMVAWVSSTSAAVAHAGTYIWDDAKVPFKQTFSFSTAETAIVRVMIPDGFLPPSDRVAMTCRIERTAPWLRPYMIVNHDRAAFYYIGRSGVVYIRTEHLKIGENELLFGDQTTTGDLIFVYGLRLAMP